jgi:integrase-like protein
LVDGIASGAIRTKAGERSKPSVVREYERSLRLHILPTLGGAKLSKLQRRDVQRLVDELLESGADPSTIRNALKPLQVIYSARSRTATSPSTRANGCGSQYGGANSGHSSGRTSTSQAG